MNVKEKNRIAYRERQLNRNEGYTKSIINDFDLQMYALFFSTLKQVTPPESLENISSFGQNKMALVLHFFKNKNVEIYVAGSYATGRAVDENSPKWMQIIKQKNDGRLSDLDVIVIGYKGTYPNIDGVDFLQTVFLKIHRNIRVK